MMIFTKSRIPGSRIKAFLAVAVLTLCYACAALFRLGNTAAPQTFYQTTLPYEQFCLKFDTPVTVREIWSYCGIGEVQDPLKNYGYHFRIYSVQGSGQFPKAEFAHDGVYKWEQVLTDFTTDCVMVEAGYYGQVLHELVLLDPEGKILTPSSVTADPRLTDSSLPLRAVDEPETFPDEDSYYSSMYFDEPLHGRTAWEMLNGLDVLEDTHPPLGKQLIAAGIALFGMNPFGWRIAAAVCGIAMVPVMYWLAWELLRSRWAAFLAAFLLSVDFMHITQTRAALVDGFLVLFILLMFLFMAKYAAIPLEKEPKKQRLWLLLSGIAMGAAISVKWNGAFAAAGLAVWFFGCLAAKCRRCTQVLGAKPALVLAVKTCAWCLLAFVLVPFALYYITFLPLLDQNSFLGWQKDMFLFHSGLDAYHPYASEWQTWPVTLFPIWYKLGYVGDQISTISLLGNPVVWLPMIFCILKTAMDGWNTKDTSALAVVAGYLCSYLPWALISRFSFIYHYFPATMFGILAIACTAKSWLTAKPSIWRRAAVVLYAAAALLAFVIYFPVITGLPVDQEYVISLELLHSWKFHKSY